MAILLFIGVIFLVLLLGMLLAFVFSRLDHTVVATRSGMAAEERAYNPGVTLGHKIKVDAAYEKQLKQARQEAARKAAATPRGANNRIGRAGKSTLSTAGKSVTADPITAVRIARFHGWDGARTGAPSVNAMAAGGAPVAVAGAPAAVAAAPTIAPPTLITITDGMAPEEVRKARIANAKAEAAYNKALKAAASGAPVAAPAGVAPAAAPAAVAAAPTVSIDPPKLIEITDDMAPEEIRKARVANAKAQAAYSKALKAAGGTPGAVTAAAPAAAAPVAAAPVAPAAPAAPAIGIDPPQLIEITDGMPPEEVRRARVANAKAEAAYNKALKAAGIDPAAMKTGAAAPAAAPAAPPEPAAPAAPVAPAAPAAPAIPAGIDPPKLIEITDDMAPEDIRRARVENAKATAAYNKALKAAGIDPASLK